MSDRPNLSELLDEAFREAMRERKRAPDRSDRKRLTIALTFLFAGVPCAAALVVGLLHLMF